MKKSKRIKIYNNILSDIKSEGIRVHHRKLRCGGDYSPDDLRININKEYRWTLCGCYILCHEFIHHKQYISGDFEEFFSMRHGEDFSDDKMKMVLDAEYDAVSRGVKMMAIYGISDYKAYELDPEYKIECINYWKREYFNHASFK